MAMPKGRVSARSLKRQHSELRTDTTVGDTRKDLDGLAKRTTGESRANWAWPHLLLGSATTNRTGRPFKLGSVDGTYSMRFATFAAPFDSFTHFPLVGVMGSCTLRHVFTAVGLPTKVLCQRLLSSPADGLVDLLTGLPERIRTQFNLSAAAREHHLQGSHHGRCISQHTVVHTYKPKLA